MNLNYFSEDTKLPLVITPSNGDVSKQSLVEWIASNKEMLNEKLREAGAVLFRGFQIDSAQDFEDVSKAMDNDLKDDYLGTSPRDKKSGFVFSASELPPHYPIMQHCEMSFLPSAPRKLFFYCHVEPIYGGETPICDFRKVYEELDPTIRDEFEFKGVKHIRNYSAPDDTSKNAFQLKKWNEMFLTTDKSIIEKKCADNDIVCEWKENNGLRLINKNAATKIHPQTGRKAWFNHAQVFHVSAAAEEYHKIFKRQKRWETLKTSVLLDVLTFYKKLTKNPNDQSMHVTFGDDSQIPDYYIEHIQDVIWRNMVIQPWKKGDVICLDNFSISHGRLPYYGPREIMVCWTS
ncbi:MAG: Taurine catabolism dioxygenase TauD/TfdA [Bacteroidota bacterium]|nr:Taurine catabolism dioxygenase TauD/TfdA [Bacteroidota bacterium]